MCGQVLTSGEIPTGSAQQCKPRYRAWDALEEPTGQHDADFGYDVDYGSVTPSPGTVHPLVLVGAPGTDRGIDPPRTEAGAVWSFRYTGTGVTAQRLDEDSTAASGRRVAGWPPQDDERFGTSIAYDEARGLLVGVPDVTAPTGGAIDWFEHDIVAGWVPSPAEPSGSTSNVSGFTAGEVLSAAAGAEFGHDVGWVPWEGGPTAGPGFIVAAPGADLALPGASTGALFGIRGSGSALGAAYSTAPGEVLVVTP